MYGRSKFPSFLVVQIFFVGFGNCFIAASPVPAAVSARSSGFLLLFDQLNRRLDVYVCVCALRALIPCVGTWKAHAMTVAVAGPRSVNALARRSARRSPRAISVYGGVRQDNEHARRRLTRR